MASYARSGQTEIKAKPRDDAYTVLLTISLFAMIGACILLFYDLKRFPSLKPSADQIRPPAAGITPAPPAEPPPGVPPAEGAPMSPDGAAPMPPAGGMPPAGDMPPGNAPANPPPAMP